ncbi:MAG: hypothetical protein MI923_17335 [Phycisphaerales bacterium]|nr:hypothetical protein [Phycisphaerales bacterium]
MNRGAYALAMGETDPRHRQRMAGEGHRAIPWCPSWPLGPSNRWLASFFPILVEFDNDRRCITM